MSTLYLNRPNWLGSEVGIVLKTITVPTTFATTVTENGRKIVKSGTVVTDGVIGLGLLWGDADITEKEAVTSLMIRGSYIDAKLPATAASSAADMAARGLYAFVEGSTTRPYQGSATLVALATPVVTVSAADITWVAITGAMGYDVADVDGRLIETTTQTGYTATATATYYVRTRADNIENTHSAYVAATVTTLA